MDGLSFVFNLSLVEWRINAFCASDDRLLVLMEKRANIVVMQAKMKLGERLLLLPVVLLSRCPPWTAAITSASNIQSILRSMM